MSGVDRIAAERKRQIEQENWTAEHDQEHKYNELALAAVCYASPVPVRVKLKVSTGRGQYFPEFRTQWVDPWPWGPEWDKREQHDYLRRLEIAGALIAAEIDRLEKAKTDAPSSETRS